MSGHITMDAQQSMFFQELNRKAHKLARMREQGLLQSKPSRNPLNAERSPRGEFKGFSFDPPPAASTAERWKYPDSDWGLMAKFSSQKGIYDAIYERERKEKEVEQQVRKIKEDNMLRINSELKKQREFYEAKRESQLALERQYKQFEDSLENPHLYAAKHNYHHPTAESNAMIAIHSELESSIGELGGGQSRSRKKHPAVSLDHFVDPNHEKVNRSSLAALSNSTKANLKALEQDLMKKNKISDFKVSTIKSLQTSHPEVLEKLRCDRAVEYIRKMEAKNKLQCSANSSSNRAFRPSGIAASTSTATLGGREDGGRRASEAAGGLPVDVLQAQLKATEDLIARQKLKIGLQSGSAKGYQTSKARHKIA